jgi:hypothetical protein
MAMSGWWPDAAVASATRLTNSAAEAKSSNW